MINATALICDQHQKFSLQPVRIKPPTADQILIRTHFSGVSIGTEFALIRNKMSWGPYPLCTGYMGTGIVEAVGADIGNFKVGDRVFYRGNSPMELADGAAVSPVSGGHCSSIVIRPNTSHGADHVPAGAGMDVAAMFVMPAVGLYGVDLAQPRMGDKVVVYGVGLVGLGVLAALVHRGCEVIAIDISDRQLDIARQLGADHIIHATRHDAAAEVSRIAPGGADVVFECTGIPACIDIAIPFCKTLGKFVWQGNYGAAPVSMKFLPPHARRLTMIFPCDDGHVPCRRAVVKNMAMGALKWEKTITHRIDHTHAPEMFDRINKGAEKDIVGVVIKWPGVTN